MNKPSRIRGCLLAGACGDALGWPVEFQSGSAIPARWLTHLEAREVIEAMADKLIEADA